MLALLRKEIQSFLSSLIGYVVIIVFLLLSGLFVWVLPGNVLDSGYADLYPFFSQAPIIFMFLIPAITMRSFSEEKRTGTIEVLFTLPLTDLQIILAKYLASLLLVIFSLLPTIIYYFVTYQLGNPVGNIDQGGYWGSFFGLFFLGAGFTAIGLFSSSLTKNQIVAFLIGVFLCYFIWTGFEQIASFETMGSLDSLIINLGINEHYQSMSRGVIDTRDLIYFIGLIAVSLLLTKTKLESRNW